MDLDMPSAGVTFRDQKNTIFVYIVLGLNAIAAWISWWVLSGAIFGTMRHVWLFPILAFSFWAVVFTLCAIFVRKRKYFFSSIAIGIVGYPVFFGASLSNLGLILLFLLFLYTERRTKQESERGIKVDFYHLVSHALKYFVTAICLIIAVVYYFSLTERPKPASAITIEAKTLETEMNWGLKAAGIVLPEDKKKLVDDIANNMSVDEFLSKNFVQPEAVDAAQTIGSPSFTTKMIGNAAAVEVQHKLLEKSKQDLAKQLGVDVVGERPMKEVLMAYIDKTERSFFEYSGTDKFYIPVILAFGIFLTARILGTAVDIFLGLFILMIIKILVIYEVVKLKQEQKEVSMIEYLI